MAEHIVTKVVAVYDKKGNKVRDDVQSQDTCNCSQGSSHRDNVGSRTED